jgi:hypothetical protein
VYVGTDGKIHISSAGYPGVPVSGLNIGTFHSFIQ